MPPQKRPAGTMWPVDKTWKNTVLARMAELGVSRSDLARMIGVTPGAITVLFRPDTVQSRLVPAIHKRLGLADTTQAAVAVENDEGFRHLTKLWNDLDEKKREHLLALTEYLAGKR